MSDSVYKLCQQECQYVDISAKTALCSKTPTNGATNNLVCKSFLADPTVKAYKTAQSAMTAAVGQSKTLNGKLTATIAKIDKAHKDLDAAVAAQSSLSNKIAATQKTINDNKKFTLPTDLSKFTKTQSPAPTVSKPVATAAKPVANPAKQSPVATAALKK